VGRVKKKPPKTCSKGGTSRKRSFEGKSLLSLKVTTKKKKLQCGQVGKKKLGGGIEKGNVASNNKLGERWKGAVSGKVKKHFDLNLPSKKNETTAERAEGSAKR